MESVLPVTVPSPDVDRLARSGEIKLFHLMVACLLERGGPMTVDEIA